MPKNHYIWTPGCKPPKIDSHSVAKHEVLQRYVFEYIRILTSRPQVENFRLYVIDGFAGGGSYRLQSNNETIYGSPIHLLQGAISAIEAVNLNRRKKIKPEINFVFVDENPNAINHLKTVVRSAVSPFPDYVNDEFLVGKFEDLVGRICSKIQSGKSKNPRAIFVLDQYGYKDVPVGTINNIFNKIQRAEIILTFSVDYLIDYLHQNPALLSRIAQTLGISSDEAGALLAAKESNVSRSVIQVKLLGILTNQITSEFFTPFFINSRKSNKSYWLLHLSRHPRARDAMTTLHWSLQNHFLHQGRAGLNMLGYDPIHENQLPHLFDEEAKQATLNALVNELPYHIPSDGIKFGQLFRILCNSTPATQEMLKRALIELKDLKQIEIRTDDGRARNPSANVLDEDIVMKPRQIWLFG